jgi:hypothetical protein
MTPKEKAKEFVNKFYFKLSNNGSLDIGLNNCTQRFNEAKDCALIAVDEILNHHSQEQGLYRIDTYYWLQVKKEIEKL